MNKLLALICFYLISNSVSAQFAYQQTISGPDLTLYESHLVDWDNDGDLDILASANYFIVWWKNLGNGQFDNQQVLCNFNNYYLSFATLDIDNDADLDIFTVTYGGELLMYEHIPGEFLADKVVLGTGFTGLACVQMSDMNDDSDADVTVTSSTDNKISWFENLGGGSFGPEIVFSNDVISPVEHHHFDLDNDGDKELVVTSYNSDELSVFINLGGGVFSAKQIISNTLNGLNEALAGDMDNDGDLDLVSVSQLDQKINWFENDGSANFDPSQEIYNTADFSKTIELVDVDGDSFLDVVTSTNATLSLLWCKNNGNGTFATPDTIWNTGPTWGTHVSINSADIDADGDMDLLSASQGYKFGAFLNDGNQNFELNMITTKTLGNFLRSMDITGNGEADILGYISSPIPKVIFYKNYGNGEFSPAINVLGASSGFLGDADAADMDNDGDLDIISSRGGSGTHGIYWHEMEDDSVINYYVINQLFFQNAYSIRPADLDGDGNIDILVAASGNNTIGWIKNLGGGNFDAPISISNSVNFTKFANAADFDGDGDLDIYASSSLDDQLILFENLGGGTFGPEVEVTNQADGLNAGLKATDIDLDGDLDLISVSGFDDKVAWYENDGNGVFSSEQIISVGQGLASAFDIVDMDNDNDPDILLAPGNMTPGILWLENDGNGNFIATYPIEDQLFNGPAIFADDVDHDLDMDVIVLSWQQNLYWLENKANYKSQIKGRIFIDINQNYTHDSTDIGFEYTPVLSTPQSDYTFTLSTGYYSMILGDVSGVYEIAPALLENWSIVTDSLSYHVLIDTTYNEYDSLDFGFYPDTLFEDVDVDLEIGQAQACNTFNNLNITVHNTGTMPTSGIVHLLLDDSLTFISSVIAPDSIVNNNLYWHYDSLSYFSFFNIAVTILTPSVNSLGDTITTFVTVSELDNFGALLYTATDSFSSIVLCAYDPNYKTVNPQGIGTFGYISPYTDELEYTIHFQNTGTFTAQDVLLKDQLDTSLFWNTVEIVAFSHSVVPTVDQFGEISFLFENIMLPDSGSNYLGSQGFIKYKVALKPNLLDQTQIFNTAEIYFDLNPAIITNTVLNTIDYCLATPQANISAIDPIVCDVDNLISFNYSPLGGIISGNGIILNQFDPAVAGIGTHTITYEYIDSLGCLKSDSTEIEVISCLGNVEFQNAYSIFPNPTDGVIYLKGNLNEIVDIQISDLSGRSIPYSYIQGNNQYMINVDCIQGFYLLKIRLANEETTTIKFFRM